MKSQRLAIAVVALVVAGSAGLFFTCFERGTEWEYRGASHEARSNAYLAWERLLDRMGHRVQIVAGPADLDASLPSVFDTIFYPANRLTLGQERSERLLHWVAAGGHLWVVTWTLWDDENRRPDWILDPLGVRQFASEDVTLSLTDVFEEAREEAEAEAEAQAEDGSDAEVEIKVVATLDADDEEEAVLVPDSMESAWPDVAWDTVEVRLAADGRAFTAYFDRNFWLELEGADPVLSLDGETGSHLLRVRHGSGIVTVATDEYLLRNDAIGSADHAELALLLVRRGEEPGAFWIVPAENWPGVFVLARRYGWAFFVAGGVWLFAWVWRAGRRFGPPIHEDPPERRSLLEHVEASGRLLGATRRDVLVGAAREVIREDLKRRRPGWLRLSDAELDGRLAGSAALAPDDVTLAFRADPAEFGKTSFVRAIATLERIRHSL